MAVVLGIDLETTGLDENVHEITEIGLVLWDTDKNQPIEMTSFLINTQFEDPVITEITGIDQELINKRSMSLKDGMEILHDYAVSADYFAAHNAQFEKKWLPLLDFKPWIDTKTDIPYKNSKGDGTLTSIAANHGFLNPFPHRALFDVMTMLKIMSLYDFSEVERFVKAETVNLALIFNYDSTGKKQSDAKKLGYYWNTNEKQWQKPTKDFLVEEEFKKANELDFHCRVLN